MVEPNGELERAVETASKLGAIDERTKQTDERTKSIETKLDKMSETFVTKQEWNPWRLAIAGFFSLSFAALAYALISGQLRFH